MVTAPIRHPNCRFLTIFGHSFQQLPLNISQDWSSDCHLRCWTGPNLNWFKSYDTKCKQKRKISKNKFINKKFGIRILTLCTPTTGTLLWWKKWSEVHLSEVTCYKIHTLIDNFKSFYNKSGLRKIRFFVKK